MLQSELGATERKKDSLKSGSKHIQSIFSTGRKLVLLSVVHCTRGTRLILKVQRAMFWVFFFGGGGEVSTHARVTIPSLLRLTMVGRFRLRFKQDLDFTSYIYGTHSWL